MNKQDYEVMKQKLSTGEFGGIELKVLTAPRIYAKVGDREYLLNGKSGRTLNRLDYHNDFILTTLRQKLTQSDIGEGFSYVGVDTVTNESEKRSLHLPLHEYGKDTYTGVLAVPNLMLHIRKDEHGNESPEAIAGIESQTSNRLLFNFVGSAPSKEREGYDRVMRGEYAIVYLNSKSGEYLAEKTPACKAAYALLAHLSPSEVTDDDLVKALGFAPVEEIDHA